MHSLEYGLDRETTQRLDAPEDEGEEVDIDDDGLDTYDPSSPHPANGSRLRTREADALLMVSDGYAEFDSLFGLYLPMTSRLRPCEPAGVRPSTSSSTKRSTLAGFRTST